MPYSVHPLTIGDMPSYISIHGLAFAESTTKMIFSRPLSEASANTLYERVASKLDDPITHFFKAVDDDTGEIIGITRWTVPDELIEEEKGTDEAEKEREDQHMAIADRLANLPEARNGGEVVRGFILECIAREKELPKGKPKIELDNLFVRPDHQGRGVARLLMKWGLDRADEMGLEILLDATEAGKPVYEKYGFEVVKLFTFDATKYGGECQWNYAYMLRLPKTKSASKEDPIDDIGIEKVEAPGIA